MTLGGVLSSLVGIATSRRRSPSECAGSATPATRQNIFWLLLPIAGLIMLIIYWAKPTKD